MYSIKIKNNELWIKNIKNDNKKYFIKISNIDLENMKAKNIKILSIADNDNYYYNAEYGSIIENNFNLENVVILNIDGDSYIEKKEIKLDLNFNKKNLIDSISNYKFVPFYKYSEHLSSLKKFNLYSPEISLFYLSEILKPFFIAYSKWRSASICQK